MDFITVVQQLGLPIALVLFGCWAIYHAARWVAGFIDNYAKRLLDATLDLIVTLKASVVTMEQNISKQTGSMERLELNTSLNGDKLTQVASNTEKMVAGMAETSRELAAHRKWSSDAIGKVSEETKIICQYPKDDK